jgi:hypothetical protein
MIFLPDDRAFVRDEIVTQNPGFLSDLEIDRWINEGYRNYCHRLMKADQGYFEQTEYLNLTANVETITLPSIFANLQSMIRSTRVERVLPTGTVPLRFRKRFDEVNPISSSVTGFAYFPTYNFRGGNLVLEPPPSSSEVGGASTGGLLLYYVAEPPKLESALCWANAGAQTLFLNNTSPTSDPRANYYNGAMVYIYSGTGAGQMNTITAYTGFVGVSNANNYKCTMKSAWGTNPDTTSVYCILASTDFPESFDDLPRLYAVKKAFLKERSRGQEVSYDSSALKEKEKDFIDLLSERTTARKFIQPFNPEL